MHILCRDTSPRSVSGVAPRQPAPRRMGNASQTARQGIRKISSNGLNDAYRTTLARNNQPNARVWCTVGEPATNKTVRQSSSRDLENRVSRLANPAN
jgi:hypothetical protein